MYILKNSQLYIAVTVILATLSAVRKKLMYIHNDIIQLYVYTTCIIMCIWIAAVFVN